MSAPRLQVEPERDPRPSEHTVCKATATKARDIRAKEDLVVETAIAWAAERAWRKRTDDAEGRHLTAIDELLQGRQRGLAEPLNPGERVRVQLEGLGELKEVGKYNLVEMDDGRLLKVLRGKMRRISP